MLTVVLNIWCLKCSNINFCIVRQTYKSALECKVDIGDVPFVDQDSLFTLGRHADTDTLLILWSWYDLLHTSHVHQIVLKIWIVVKKMKKVNSFKMFNITVFLISTLVSKKRFVRCSFGLRCPHLPASTKTIAKTVAKGKTKWNKWIKIFHSLGLVSLRYIMAWWGWRKADDLG